MSGERKTRFLPGVVFLLAAVVLFMSIAASTGAAKELRALVYLLPGEDMTGHFLFLGALAFASGLAFIGRERDRQWRQWGRVVLVLLLMSTLEESSQLLLTRRTFSLVDLGANYAGVLLFASLAFAMRWSSAPLPVVATEGPVG